MSYSDERVALHRYQVISPALAPRLTPAERGLIVREIAAAEHPHPSGDVCRYSRSTIDRWIRAYSKQGLRGLSPGKRSDVGAVRRNPQLLEEAEVLRKERPQRSASHISDILLARHGIKISERTVRQHLRRRGLTRTELTKDNPAYGRFQAERANELWVGDVLVGPWVPHPRVKGSRRARLFCFLDDFSRLLLHGVWVTHENTRSGQEVLKATILRRGVPEAIYLDNAASFSSSQMSRTCAVLGIRLVHSRPYRPQGRGKVERIFRVVRERFILEIETTGVGGIEELNQLYMAFSERVLNTRVHSETKMSPIERFISSGERRAADPEKLFEAFRWSSTRTVTRTATVSLAGNRYQVDASLLGRKVELRYMPEDLTRIDVYYDGAHHGSAIPFVISRHVHPQAPQSVEQPGEKSGVDYLGMVLKAEQDAITEQISFRLLPEPRDEENEDQAGDEENGDQDPEQ